VEKVLGDEQDPSEPPRYFIKYKGQSYVHCEWKTKEEILAIHRGDQAFVNFIRKCKKDGHMMVPCLAVPNLQTLPKDELTADSFEVARVIAQDSEGRYLVMWENGEDATWEDSVDDDAALAAFHQRENSLEAVLALPPPRRPEPWSFREYGTAPGNLPIPTFKGGEELRDYQVLGLNWLRNCWYWGRSSILADEMGLGKTVQGVCMINELVKLGFRGPFLVVAPLSTLTQWEREFHRWTDLNVIRCTGNAPIRKVITEYELYWGNRTDVAKFEVLILNYEKLKLPDMFELVSSFTWEYMIVDEAHKLKNAGGKLYQIMEGLSVKHKLLMTGTPIQNDLKELRFCAF
jgi:chromodomain-helicase-DNA-binding protein 7